jgi:hypothetical protein
MDRFCPEIYSPDNSACQNNIRRENKKCIECKRRIFYIMSKVKFKENNKLKKLEGK